MNLINRIFLIVLLIPCIGGCQISNQIVEDENLEKLKNYSIKFSPQFIENEKIIVTPTNIDDELIKALSICEIKYPKQTLEYLTIVLLKLYNYQILCCHQSYDLTYRNEISIENTPIQYYFFKLSYVKEIKEFYEFIPSSEVYKYVSEHKKLLSNEELNNIYTEITKNLKKIE